MSPVFRRFGFPALALALAAAACPSASHAQTPDPQQQSAPPPVQEEKKKEQQQKAAAVKDLKNPTGEQVAETVIAVYGQGFGRQVLWQVRRNGVERGRTTRLNTEGKPEEITFEHRFIRGENFAKDKMRLDQKLPTMEYALIYNQGSIFGIINNTPFTPREQTASEFLAPSHHGIDALLRYKENGSTVTFVTKDKQKGIDLWVVDLEDKEKRKTRYYVSANPDVRLTARVLWLEYEEPGAAGAEPVKFRRTFHEYRYAQSTLVPFRSVLYANGRQVEETRVQTVTYGIKMDDSFFKNPEAAAR
jgi:hypothetical protein